MKPPPEEEAQDLVPLPPEPYAGRVHANLVAAIADFESGLDDEHEVALGLAGSDVAILRIEGIGWIEPDTLTFDGTDDDGTRIRLVQHVSQLNVTLVALPRSDPEGEPRRIGFRLAASVPADAGAPMSEGRDSAAKLR